MKHYRLLTLAALFVLPAYPQEIYDLILKGGHVSLVAGANAIKRLWPKLDSWLGKRST